MTEFVKLLKKHVVAPRVVRIKYCRLGLTVWLLFSDILYMHGGWRCLVFIHALFTIEQQTLLSRCDDVK